MGASKARKQGSWRRPPLLPPGTARGPPTSRPGPSGHRCGRRRGVEAGVGCAALRPPGARTTETAGGRRVAVARHAHPPLPFLARAGRPPPHPRPSVCSFDRPRSDGPSSFTPSLPIPLRLPAPRHPQPSKCQAGRPGRSRGVLRAGGVGFGFTASRHLPGLGRDSRTRTARRPAPTTRRAPRSPAATGGGPRPLARPRCGGRKPRQ